MAEYDDYKNYVTETDFEMLKKFAGQTSQSRKYALTFREAGENTIMRLNQGAGAKPHDILEKTVKAGADNCIIPEGISYDDVKGFVGHWEGTNVLQGIYLTTYGAEVFSAIHEEGLIIPVRNPFGRERPVLNLRYNNADEENAMVIVKRILHWESCFFTGDYDLHDSLEKAAGWNHLIEGTQDHVTFFNRINHALLLDTENEIPDGAKREYSAKVAGAACLESDYQRIQHGAQFGYLAYMLNHEAKQRQEDGKREVAIVEKVAKKAFPLAACIGKEGGTMWRIIKTHDEYANLYKELGVQVKVPWQNDGEFSAFMTRLGETYHVKE
ncbi:MAG: hypothetical protein LBK83_06015 [Treponema sp.]|nr:hypothetical protein [Treponema sp.]